MGAVPGGRPTHTRSAKWAVGYLVRVARCMQGCGMGACGRTFCAAPHGAGGHMGCVAVVVRPCAVWVLCVSVEGRVQLSRT